jgi:hypothetical protein
MMPFHEADEGHLVVDRRAFCSVAGPGFEFGGKVSCVASFILHATAFWVRPAFASAGDARTGAFNGQHAAGHRYAFVKPIAELDPHAVRALGFSVEQLRLAIIPAEVGLAPNRRRGYWF